MEDGGFFDLIQFIQKPVVMDTFVDILLCAVPIWLAVMIGLLIGWSWRPRWTGLIYLGFRSKFRFLLTAAASIFCARRLWFAFTALSAFSLMRTLWSYLRGKEKQSEGASSAASSAFDVCHESAQREHDIVTENDLDHLLHILNKDAEISWQSMMERTTPSMKYQAWRHDPENGPTVYRSRTVFEDATAELVRDFFWDDEFRPKWDPMLIYFKILEECPHTGASVVHWIKKFPFFCSDREYIIGRRIWEAGKIYYCITKGVPYSSMPKCDKPRRVDRYFSSWVIKPVESRKGDGQLSACEVNLIHYEDMGIPKDVAKLGVRHGMWGTVKKLHSGMRAYQNTRKSDVSLSRSAILAKITTNISFDGGDDALNEIDEDRQRQGIDWKWVIIGGTVAVACGLRTGLIGKALLIGAGRGIMKRVKNSKFILAQWYDGYKPPALLLSL